MPPVQVADLNAVAEPMRMHKADCKNAAIAEAELTFTPEAVQHILHIARLLQLPGGHAWVAGPTGTCKSIHARFAASFAGLSVVAPTQSDNAPPAEAFRQQLKVRFCGLRFCAHWKKGARFGSAPNADDCSHIGHGRSRPVRINCPLLLHCHEVRPCQSILTIPCNVLAGPGHISQ